MARPVEVVRLTGDQIHEAGDLIGRACAEDPFWAYVWPSRARRTRAAMAAAGRALVAHGTRHGEVYATTRPLDGIAIWLPPVAARLAPAPVRLLRLAAETGLPPAPTLRFLRATHHLELMRRRALPDRRWTLLLIAVNAPLRGQGIGHALLAPILERADRDGLPCVASSLRARDVLFFVHRGFEAAAESDLPGGPKVWTLRRLPRG
ncbi:MAG: hypothetical protein AVDCRST_MAG73-657 [uncultured Thermomicrobiales bacterium]|uniref:N-acetyltransferase domain-containing protein n=1 Tax=uncultured Thermomicrobiales bacterium TaxID=1645740 RepID=A0A6J4TN41_9BACT|nr:MAG: hypothetical protein AVDCRST_MAG73-657 [uncultured Thermomicrobiales bacterium]